MKNILLLLLLFPALIYSQIPDENEQLKVTYSMEYEKIPFKMRVIKKLLPTEFISYYSKLGSRVEIKKNAKMFGKHMETSTISVKNDSLNIHWEKIVLTVNDSIVENQFTEKKPETKKTQDDILLGSDTKKILGYDCVYFSAEDDSSKTNGFLTPDISGQGEFKNHGLPLEFTTTSKKEKMIVVTKVEKISTEELEPRKFILNKK